MHRTRRLRTDTTMKYVVPYNKGVFTLLSENFLYIEDKLTMKTAVTGDLNMKFVNNIALFLSKKPSRFSFPKRSVATWPV